MTNESELYIWCLIGKSNVYPLGHAKTLEYAMSLGPEAYPDPKNVKLFKLVEMLEICQNCKGYKHIPCDCVRAVMTAKENK